MADKSVGELIAAQSVTPTDLFVLEQNGTAKKLTGQILENWLVSFADGHGGIQNIAKLKTEGLADTYRITMADTTIFDFVVTNGKSVNSIEKTSTSGLVDTYTITYNDATTGTFTVTNGAKGDKGDNAYVWIKYASQEPTASSNSFGDIPDNWMGVYFGILAEAPTDWQQYRWFRIKGEQGNTGEPATLVSSAVEYQVGDSGTVIPSGAWSSYVPVVAQGKHLWTRTTNTFNTGSPVVSYSVSRMGLDGSGSVSSVANISPDENGNVPLTAENVGALPDTGGKMTGELKMNGQPISGLNAPTANDQAANMGFVNQQMKKAAPRDLLDNNDFINPVNQRGKTSYAASGYAIDRWRNANGTFSVDSGFCKWNTLKTAVIKRFSQIMEKPLQANTPYTIAMLARVNEAGTSPVYFRPATSYGSGVSDVVGLKFAEVTNDFQWFVHTFTTVDDNAQALELLVLNNTNAYLNIDIKHLCCYEGEYTLETLPKYRHKGYAAELIACQTQLQRFRTETERKTYCEDFRPTMRMTPNGMVSKFEQEIDGITYYFASAEL